MAEHHIPALTVALGTVLDLVIGDGHERIFVSDWDGWHLLTSPNAFDVTPGRARLFLVRGRLHELEQLEGDELEGEEAYERWTERSADHLGELELPSSSCSFRHGRLLRLGYRSDKWNRRGQTVDYDHDFTEHGAQPPWIYTDHAHLERSGCAVVTGGTMTVTEGGIDG